MRLLGVIVERAVQKDPDMQDGQSSLYLGPASSALPPDYPQRARLVLQIIRSALDEPSHQRHLMIGHGNTKHACTVGVNSA